MDQNGLISKIAGSTSAAAASVADEIVNPTPNTASYASIVDDVLSKSVTPQTIVIHTGARKVYVSDNSTTANALKNAINNNSDGHDLLIPDAGQEGRSLTWDNDGGDLPQDIKDILAPVYSAAKPKRTLASFVSQLLNQMGTHQPGLSGRLAVVIDQNAGEVRLHILDDFAAAATALAAVTPAVGSTSMGFALAEPAEAGEAAPLKFEGGSF